jgi:hypothetical protein
MRPGVTALSAALVVALVVATSSHEAQPVPRATATDGTVRIGGVPQFLIGKHLHSRYPNAIGYSLPDEPDGNGVLPPTADPDSGERVP